MSCDQSSLQRVSNISNELVLTLI